MKYLVGYSVSWFLVLAVVTFIVFPVSDTIAQEALIDDARQQELRYLLKHDCGSCHGMRLKGGLGPSLLPEALAGKPDIYLKQVISKGMPGSAMPPWEKMLSEADIDYLVSLLLTAPAPELEVEE